MKKIILTLCVLLSLPAISADRVKAKATTDLLNTYTTSSASATPDRALAFRSNRDNVDDHETIATPAMTTTITPTEVIMVRGEALNLTNCSADYGTVTVNATQIRVLTTKAPIKVLCAEANGIQKVFYTTYKAP